MAKELVGHHLMRVRIRKNIFEKLQLMAEEESERTDEHVTVSDLVRSAIYSALVIHESVRKLENAPPPMLEEHVLFVARPML